MAVAKVMRGEMLPPNGNHFFLVSADGATVLRKCDRTVIARIPIETSVFWSNQISDPSRLTWKGGTMASVAADNP
jgi:hypothetical protein